MALVAGLVVAVLAVPPAALAEPMGVVGYFGNPSSAGSPLGGLFSTTPNGVAVNDGTGDIYVMDSGNGRVERFDSENNFISAWGSDVIPNGAAGTANTSSGSSQLTGVVATSRMFLPGQTVTGAGIQPNTTITAMTKGANATLTLSKPATATATGVALSVASGTGNLAVNEVQTVTVTATGGTFRLTVAQAQGFAAATTANIPYNASPATVQSALEAISQIGAGNVSVTSFNPGGDAGVPGGPYVIEFQGVRANTEIVQMTVAAGLTTPLTGGSATIATATDGGIAYEICTIAAECKSGTGAAFGTAPGGMLAGANQNNGALVSPATGLAVSQQTGHVFVTNTGRGRIEEFTANGGFVRAFGGDVVRTGRPGDAAARAAQQTLTIDAAGGTFRLSFRGQTTGDLAFDVPASGGVGATASVQNALQALSTVGSGNATVTGGVGAAGGGTPYAISFAGTLNNSPQPPITAGNGATPLSGGAATATVANTTTGRTGVEICETTADCQSGTVGAVVGSLVSTSPGYPAVAPAGSPNAGNVLVPDALRRVLEYNSSGQLVRVFGGDVTAAGPGDTGTGFEVCNAADLGNVCKDGAAGAGAGEFATGQPTRIAESAGGEIYTVESTGSFRVQRFTLPGNVVTPQGAFAGSLLTGSSASGAGQDNPTDVAVASTGNVFVVKVVPAGAGTPAAGSQERRLFELEPDGDLVDTHMVNNAVNSVNGLAVKGAGDRAFVTSSTTPRTFVVAEPVPPSVAVEPTTAVGQRSATLHGTVNPNEVDPGTGAPTLTASYRFEYSTNGTDWTRVPASDVDVGAGTADIPVTQDVTGLEPNRHYQVRLVAVKGGAPTTSTGDAGDFTTLAAAPDADTLDAWWDGATGQLTVRGQVNPNNQATGYHFEYGPTASYGDTIPIDDASVGDGGQTVEVTQTIGDLDPDSVYHYRIVAVNATGTVAGSDRVVGAFMTPPARAYELVSNGDSQGIGLAKANPVISDDGERVVFIAQAFDGQSGAPGVVNPFVAQRGGSGWSVKPVTPDPSLSVGLLGENDRPSADLAKFVWNTSSVAQGDRAEIPWTFTDLDGAVTPAHPLIKPVSLVGQPRGANDRYQVVGGSRDLSSFVFSPPIFTDDAGGVSLLAGEPLPVGIGLTPGHLYQVTDAGTVSSTLHLVNRATDGSVIGGVCGSRLGGMTDDTSSPPATNAVSADGSMVYFSARPSAPATGLCDQATHRVRLFKRVGNETTVAVSASQCGRVSPACATAPGNDLFQGASTDGSKVFFTSSRQLTDSDLDSTEDLYLYDASPPAGQPSLVQASAGAVTAGHATVGAGAEVLGVVDNAADGSRVYFVAKGQLAGTATPGENNLYVFERSEDHPAGRIQFVAPLYPGATTTVGVADARQWNRANEDKGRAAHALPVREDGTAGDGRFLLFSSRARLVGSDRDSVDDVYRYDDSAGALICLSCAGNAELPALLAGRRIKHSPAAYEQTYSRAASADASSVIFATAEALLPADGNSTQDVYVWREGTLSLVTGGTGAAGAAFTDRSVGDRLDLLVPSGISRDGEHVFFMTTASLVGADTNNGGIDLYVARAGGGFAEPPQPPPACDALADGCRGGGAGAVSADRETSAGAGADNAEGGVRTTLWVGAVRAAARRAAARSGRLTLRVRTTSSGKLSVVARGRVGAGRRVLGRGSRTVSRPGATAVTVRLGAAARRALRRGRTVTLSISVRQAGARSRSLTVRLRRAEA